MIVSGIDVETGLAIEVEFDSKVVSIQPAKGKNDLYLSPAFIDVQVNGYAGADYNSPATSYQAIEHSIQVIHGTGVARFFPTIITGPAEQMVAALRNVAAVKNAAIAGFHVEGPHLSPEDGPRGAHLLASIRKPDLAEYRTWQEATEGRIRIVTISPHWEGAPCYIEAVARDSVTVSIGHTHANEQQIADAVSAGATMSTHLGNAAHAVIRKQPNYIWEQLADDRLSASFIADKIHLQRAFLKSSIRAKGVARSVLVTDASAPAGCPPGRYFLGAQTLDLTMDGRVILAGTERLAGSALRMSDGIANVMSMAQVSLREAVGMATTNPARLCGLRSGIVIGAPADLVLFKWDGTIAVESVYRDGVLVAHSGNPGGTLADPALRTGNPTF